ncbi:TlpA disulfide reductase family protein [Undibacterium sp. TS12]|uniref:peroxiredoxin family protein n=1 Tax=Undibacterium sp. TS12 TaxID=2908202 RepID=UPI001F4C940C|nr:TlpA disulfide reductase family protein [Undibacterium sp. TS12]MCH8617780.1 TlpA family protein disulfide reductase [Undibacterium sp. TS12]
MFRMKQFFVAASILAAALSVQLSHAAGKEEFPAKPALSGTMLNGKAYKLNPAKGDVVLVTFWATWCPTCRAEMPTFRKFYEANKKSGFEMVTVSIDDAMSDIDEYSRLSNWMTKTNQNFPSLWRNDPSYKDNFGKVFATPTAFLIGRDGKVIESFKGAIKPAQWTHIKAVIDAPAPAAKG